MRACDVGVAYDCGVSSVPVERRKKNEENLVPWREESIVSDETSSIISRFNSTVHDRGSLLTYGKDKRGPTVEKHLGFCRGGPKVLLRQNKCLKKKV